MAEKDHPGKSGICLFRIPKQGGRAIWEITNTCNYGCRYCIFSSTTRQQKDELDTAKVFETLGQLKESGFTHLKITGGEPFTRPDLMDILRRCRALGFSTDLSTNASTIDAAIAAELAALDLEMVHVSLDGHTKELQEAVRGKRTYLPTLDGLSHLAKAGLYLRIGCVIYKDNQHSMGDIAEFCANLGANEVIFSLMEPVGRMRGRTDFLATLDPATLKKSADAAAEAMKGRIKVSSSFVEVLEEGKCGTCPGGDKFLFIDHKGRVSPCTWVAERAPAFRAAQTLHTHTLREILQGPENAGFRKIVSACGFDRCPMQMAPDFLDCARTDALFTGELAENIQKNGKFSEASALYAFTTENIGGYFGRLDFNKAKVLTVGASFDHLINAYMMGAAHVTCFDINALSLHMGNLKLAMLQELERSEFIAFFAKSFAHEMYKRVRAGLPLHSRYFWDRAYSAFANDGRALLSSALFSAAADKDMAIRRNPYLQNDENYALARAACHGKKMDFIQGDVTKLAGMTKNNFNIIMLSNISDYAHKMFDGADCLAHYRDRIVSPMMTKLEDGGRIAFGYVYDGLDLNRSSARSPINIAAARQAAFMGENYEEIEIPSVIEDGNHDIVLMMS